MRVRRPSITRRLIVALTIGMAVFWCIAVVGGTYVFNDELNETFDFALRETALRLLPLVVENQAVPVQAGGDVPGSSASSSIEYIAFEARDAAGRVLARTTDPAGAPVDLYDGAPSEGFRTIGDFRTYSVTDQPSGITVTVAETTDHRHEAIAESTQALVWPLLLLIPLGIAGIWLVVRHTLAPVKRLSEQIAARHGGNLVPIDATSQPAELKPIADAVGQLIERLKAALDAERAFAANSAHELRTPIAGALAQTQLLIAELEGATGKSRAMVIEQSLKRLAGLSEKLLQISRVDAGLATRATPVDLVPVLDLVVGNFRAGLEVSGRLSYLRDEDARLIAPLDMDAFAIVARNLIENALRHGRPDGQIVVQLHPNRQLSVRNAGDAVAPETLAVLPQRFTRGDTASDGSGLGLAIVASIMQHSGGRLELHSPAREQVDGFEAVLEFPQV